eukprot:CAMPEP_0114414026 /NCGR_PEP_ID=MMETSP0103-20121206/1169_1 /TAXON_ID=37642 ORGANISM="Paraphysomonas imperforata, Strain PA2" /NCGR_SAMPLE_ID=MMETSP0103 /ASSEMBLY_ACC=CAM_ASM_000201 /LENGTH=66 /DNA_ID=CAMNT_0001582141 /DNA_START=224 /DNA_END=424 /DNA_ORIENTATION=-
MTAAAGSHFTTPAECLKGEESGCLTVNPTPRICLCIRLSTKAKTSMWSLRLHPTAGTASGLEMRTD